MGRHCCHCPAGKWNYVACRRGLHPRKFDACRLQPFELRGAADSPHRRRQRRPTGEPLARRFRRKVDTTSTKLVYVWFLADVPAGAPVGFHGCEMEVTVDIRSEHVLGYSLENIGWGNCKDLRRKIRVAER